MEATPVLGGFFFYKETNKKLCVSICMCLSLLDQCLEEELPIHVPLSLQELN